MTPTHRYDLSMTRFVKYVLSPGAQRIALVQSFSDSYSVAKDPYRQARLAVQTGRRTGQDKQAMDSAIQNCRPRMRNHYIEIARGWLPFIEQRKDTSFIPPGTGRWHTSELTIKVTPELVLVHPNGATEAMKLHLHSDPISTEGAEVMLWLMQQTLDQSHPGARPMVVDVRRQRVYTKVPPRPEYASWLESEAASLAFLYRRRAA